MKRRRIIAKQDIYTGNIEGRKSRGRRSAGESERYGDQSLENKITGKNECTTIA